MYFNKKIIKYVFVVDHNTVFPTVYLWVELSTSLGGSRGKCILYMGH